MAKANRNIHMGSSLDDLLEETGDSAEVSAIAIKRVIALEVQQKMKVEAISKTAMAELMRINRSTLDRLLDPEKTSVTLNTLYCAARAIGKKLQLTLV